MKNSVKKIIFSFLILIIFILQVHAEVKCTEPSNGDEILDIYWDNERYYIGETETQVCNYKCTSTDVTKKPLTKTEAQNLCSNMNNRKPECCTNKDPKYPSCPDDPRCKGNGNVCSWGECAKKVNIYYEGEGGRSCSPKTVDKGSTAGTLCSTSRNGYRFNGWWNRRDCTGRKVTSNTTINDNIILYACWKEQVTITYNNQEGTGCTSKTVDKGSIAGTLCTPTKAGYSFVSWRDNPNCSGAIYKSDSKMNANKTLYACWNYVGNGNKDNTINCPAGYFYLGSKRECQKCSGNYYCPGVKAKDNGNTQGKYSCGANFTVSNDNSQCYRNIPPNSYWNGNDISNCPTGTKSKEHRVSYTATGGKPISTDYMCKTSGGQNLKTYIINFDSDRQVALNDNNFYSTKYNIYASAALDSDTHGGSSSDSDKVYCSDHYVKYKTCERTSSTCNPQTQKVHISMVSYKLRNEGDSVYCLQPGKSGPTSAGLYYEKLKDKVFDIADCSNQFYTFNKTPRVECGLAQILYQTVEKKSDDKYISNKKYDNGSITFALRLWMAKYAGKNQIGLGGNGFGSDDPEVQWVTQNTTENNYYKETIAVLNKIKSYNDKEDLFNKYNDQVKNHPNAIRCADEYLKKGFKECGIYDAIYLFKEAEQVSDDNYLGGEDFIKKTPEIKMTPVPNSDKYGDIYRISLPKEIQSIIVDEKCKDINNPECAIEIKFFDSEGKEIPKKSDKNPDGVGLIGNCDDKGNCEIKVDYNGLCKKTINQQEMGQNYIRLYLKNWYQNSGWIKFYQAKNNASNYQEMISFAFNRKKCEDKIEAEQTEKYYEYEVTFDCPCGEDKCNDIINTKKVSVNCNTKEEKTINVDPNMNCIVNTCKRSDRVAFDESENLGADTNVCNVYCKEANDFYLANKGDTVAYGGMRFSYDILPKLIKNGIVDSSFKAEQKLTSVVVQKKLCTSVINYESWKKTFDYLNKSIEEEDNGNIIDFYKGELNNWIYSLQNCNFYDSKDIVIPFGTIDTKEIKTIKDNIKSLSLDISQLDLSYADSVYGNTRTMGKVENNSLSQVTYCTNSASKECYKFEKDKEVYLEGKNSIKDLKYCNGNNCNNVIKLPTNDYASIELSFEIGFYQPLKYYAEEYSGVSVLKDDLDKDKAYMELPDYEYPIKINTEPGEYDVYYNFKNVGKMADYEYVCQYKVEKTTPTIPCEGEDCENPSNPIEPDLPICEGEDCDCTGPNCGCIGENCECTGEKCEEPNNPIQPDCIGKDCDCIGPDCICEGPNCICTGEDCKTTPENPTCEGSDCTCEGPSCSCSGSDCVCNGNDCEIPTGTCKIVYKSGAIDLSQCPVSFCNDKIIFRNVKLDNLFPNTRKEINNWTFKQDIIDEIQTSANSVMSDDGKHLQYRYTLTPEGIKQIQQYNNNQKDVGGYLNNTLSCETSKDRFINCQSDFLREINEGNARLSRVIVNKAGDEQ